MNTHIVIGGTGAVGRATVRALLAKGHNVTSVSTRGRSLSGEKALAIDLRDPQATRDVAKAADVVHLTVGLPYKTSVWKTDWPLVVQNVAGSSAANGARLLFLDNVYAYGKVSGPMTERTPIHPNSEKGKVRAELLAQLERIQTEKSLDYAVIRSADFYGPGVETSVFTTMALRAIARGKKPTWLFNSDLPHSMTYVPDIADALVTIAEHPDTHPTTWHVPTAPPLTGADYMRLAGATKTTTLGKGMVRMGALMNSAAKESLELAYQSTSPYVFDSSLFETTFGVKPTTYATGINETLAWEKKNRADS